MLSIGGESLIRGSLGAATKLNISPLLCGIFIVGFGTSTPELVVSIKAATSGNPDIAIGNVVGSNIGNVLLILGLCALITPLLMRPKALTRDALSALGASLIFTVLVLFNSLNTIGAIILLSSFILYLGWVYLSEKVQTSPPAKLHISEAKEVIVRPKSALFIILAIFIGLLLLIVGSQVLLEGAVSIAKSFDISDSTVGLTLVALGTSLPELSISVIAAFRRHTDVAVGNILGSNIFNVLGILGISALLQPLPASDRVLYFDQWVMLASSFLLILLLFTVKKISRMTGVFLLFSYCLYNFVGFTYFN